MKCPKCGYIGFERAEKCRNCGYDFSLLNDPLAEIDLPLRRDEPLTPPADFDFSTGQTPPPAAAPRPRNTDFDLPPRTPAAGDLPLFQASSVSSTSLSPAPVPIARPRPITPPPEPPSRAPVSQPAPPPPSVSRAKPSPNPARAAVPAAFDFREPEPGMEREAKARPATPAARTRMSTATEAAGSLARAIAGLVDAIILLGLDAAVLYFTLRVCRLSFGDVLVLPLAPLIAFCLMLDGGYLVAFTAVGGQTIGKMAASLKVIREEGGQVVPGQAAVRAVGYLASFLPAGLGFVPALFGPSRRALHDRLANTRVVRL